jgi:hypothetical protein
MRFVASFDHLTATKPLAWRLGYIAVIEATFTPYFKVFLDHEGKLFEPGDERVASLFLWHFVEEIEHGSSALMVYDAVHGSYLYRLKTIGGVVKHLNELLGIISRGFAEHVPDVDGADMRRSSPRVCHCAHFDRRSGPHARCRRRVSPLTPVCLSANCSPCWPVSFVRKARVTIRHPRSCPCSPEGGSTGTTRHPRAPRVGTPSARPAGSTTKPRVSTDMIPVCTWHGWANSGPQSWMVRQYANL